MANLLKDGIQDQEAHQLVLFTHTSAQHFQIVANNNSNNNSRSVVCLYFPPIFGVSLYLKFTFLICLQDQVCVCVALEIASILCCLSLFSPLSLGLNTDNYSLHQALVRLHQYSSNPSSPHVVSPNSSSLPSPSSAPNTHTSHCHSTKDSSVLSTRVSANCSST